MIPTDVLQKRAGGAAIIRYNSILVIIPNMQLMTNVLQNEPGASELDFRR